MKARKLFFLRRHPGYDPASHTSLLAAPTYRSTACHGAGRDTGSLAELSNVVFQKNRRVLKLCSLGDVTFPGKRGRLARKRPRADPSRRMSVRMAIRMNKAVAGGVW
jgi:hypothetical protein